MSERALRFRLGLFVLIALVLLAVMILMFGSVNLAGWFRRANHYTLVFSETPGASIPTFSPGTPVRRSGVRIGDVTDVTLDDESGQVIVGIAVDRRFTIRHHERPTLNVSVLGGDATIDFVAQRQEPNQPPLDRSAVASGETLTGVAQPTVGTILSRADEAQQLMIDIRKSLQNLEKLTPAAEDTMREFRELAREARNFVPELKNTNKEAQAFLRSAQEVMPDAKKAAEEIRRLATALNGGEAPREESNRPPPASESPQFVSLNLPAVQREEANTSLPKLVRQANEIMPEVKKFIAAANDTMPELKKTVRDIGATAQQYNKLGESLDRFVKDNQQKMGRIVDNVNATLDRALDLLSNENRRNITDTIRNLRNTSDRLPEMTKNLDEALKEGRDTAKRMRQSMDKADEAITSLRDVAKPLGERGPSITRNLDESLDKMNKVLGDLRELLRVVGESDGTFRRLLNDPALYNHLDDTVLSLGKMMPRLERILKDFETFADKLARHPESIGLGGVVRPGSGVKDPPAPYPGHVVPPR